jgi:hypothetical protein
MFFLLSFLILSGCTLTRYQPIRFEEYAAKQQIFDLTFGWNQSITDRKLTIDGYARNNRYFIVNNLELWVSLVAKDGREKTRATFFFIPADLRLGDSARFTVSLNELPQSGDILRFFYRYNAHEDNEEAFTWVNSFEVKALE